MTPDQQTCETEQTRLVVQQFRAAKRRGAFARKLIICSVVIITALLLLFLPEGIL